MPGCGQDVDTLLRAHGVRTMAIPNPHHNFCLRCLKLGQLLHCETAMCRHAMHLPCAGLTSVPTEAWYCDVCRAKQASTGTA